MKKITLSLSMLFFIVNSFCQTQTTTFSKEYYLEKSKKQKKTGWIVLGTGLGIAAIGGLVQLSNSNSSSWNFDFTGAYIAIGGGVLSLASIPCFVSAAKNKKMAVALTIDNQNILLPQDNSFTFKKQPSLCLRIEL
ncbi:MULTISPECIES: hypothetical protein [Flavobacterium]|uniref:Uncharacterized protein n=1 Tax=Flavobacterium commune TaxID=1306519 RepID=A0A1D9PDG7_9FLAO|nr:MULTISPECIES: hypothetical protein [Flavobacterium]APA00614.1 hypothetical protein BIW12_14940 [Flavobacterium commune]